MLEFALIYQYLFEHNFEPYGKTYMTELSNT